MNSSDYHRPDLRRGAYGMAPYRSRRGVFFGVCRRAWHFDFSVAGTRLLSSFWL